MREIFEDDTTAEASFIRGRRSILIGGTGALLSSCSGLISHSPFFSTLANFRRPANGMIDANKVAQLPYASLKANFSGGATALMVLGEYLANDRLAWYSADRQLLVTWGPFVARLLGLDVNLYDTRFTNGWTLDIRQLLGRRLERSLDFQSPTGRVSVHAISRFSAGGQEEVKLLSGARTLQKISEHVVADRYHQFRNHYWIDTATGFCWKSRQVVVPTMTPLNLEITKAPKGS